MSEGPKSPWGRPKRGPGAKPPVAGADKGPWQRRDGDAASGSGPAAAPPRRPERPASTKPAWKDAPEGRSRAPRSGESEGGWRRDPEAAGARPQRAPEQKVCGMNAALAAFAARPDALRKVFLGESRIGALRELLAYCVAKRLGYRVVEDAELERVSGSSHHEGVCLLLTPPPALDLESLLARLPRSAPVRLLWLDGVGNPHNLGAVLRSAAHFGAAAVLLPPSSPLSLSAAAARVAEGGAEHVPLVRIEGDGVQAELAALDRLAEAGFVSLATLPVGGDGLYAHPLPARTVFVLGAEGEGMQQRIVDHCARRLSIPGSGRVESLNIANAVAVLLGEHWRQHPPLRA
ncbi:MAG: rRNA methyltransferase [Aquimonas sp.]|nr:rRNA methyltransferase [Aquimonas sp.]